MSYLDQRFQRIVSGYAEISDAQIKAEMTRHEKDSPERAAFEHILNERRNREDASRHQELISAAMSSAKREQEHTLVSWWRLATWSERMGMIGTFGFVFFVGYLCAKTNFMSRAIDLIREVLP